MSRFLKRRIVKHVLFQKCQFLFQAEPIVTLFVDFSYIFLKFSIAEYEKKHTNLTKLVRIYFLKFTFDRDGQSHKIKAVRCTIALN